MLLKKNHADDKFSYGTDVIIEHMSIVIFEHVRCNYCNARPLVLFKTWLYLSYNQIKWDYPHHVIIKHHTFAELANGIAKSA